MWKLKHLRRRSQEECLHKAERSASSCPLADLQLSLWPSFVTGKPYHAAPWVSHPPTSVLLSLSLSPEIHSQQYAAVATLTCGGSLTGAPFNCLVQAAASWGEMTALKSFVPSLLPICTAVIPSLRMLVFPCYSLQPAPSPVTRGLFIPGRLMWYKMSLNFKKKKKWGEEMILEISGLHFTSFLPLPTLIRHDGIG